MMKKITVLSGVLGAVLLVIGQVMRFMALPGWNIVHICGLIAASLFALGVALHARRTTREDRFSQKIEEIGKEKDDD
ncbi:MAG: hypothetical protein R3C61_09330 [Bacteroidia bacterium]